MKLWTVFIWLAAYDTTRVHDRMEFDIPAESREAAQGIAAEIREDVRAALVAAGNHRYMSGLSVSGAPTGEVAA